MYEFRWLPPHIYGGSIFSTVSVLKRLLTAASYVTLVNIDDFYLSYLAYILEIPLTQNNEFSFTRMPLSKLHVYLTSHGYRGSEVLSEGWRVFKKNNENTRNY